MGVTSVEMMKPSSVKSLASSSSVRSSWIVSTRPASVEVAMMLYFGMFDPQFRRLLKTKGRAAGQTFSSAPLIHCAVFRRFVAAPSDQSGAVPELPGTFMAPKPGRLKNARKEIRDLIRAARQLAAMF